MRYAIISGGIVANIIESDAVSYTHLDVYKRQVWGLSIDQAADVARTMSDGTDAGKTAAVALVAQAATAQKTISASLIESYTALSSKYSALLNAALPTNLTEYDAALKLSLIHI